MCGCRCQAVPWCYLFRACVRAVCGMCVCTYMAEPILLRLRRHPSARVYTTATDARAYMHRRGRLHTVNIQCGGYARLEVRFKYTHYCLHTGWNGIHGPCTTWLRVCVYGRVGLSHYIRVYVMHSQTRNICLAAHWNGRDATALPTVAWKNATNVARKF